MKKKIWKNYYDVVILPPKPIATHAIALSKQAQQYGSTLGLGRTQYIPHISLYHIPVRTKDFSEFLRTLKVCAKKQKRGLLQLRGVQLFKPHRSGLLLTSKPRWLQKLCEEVIDVTIRYFDPKYNVKEKWHADRLPRPLQQNLNKYGTPMVGKYFMPHITFAKFEDIRGMNAAARELRARPLHWKVSAIYICELGPFHSCQRVVHKISLGIA